MFYSLFHNNWRLCPLVSLFFCVVWACRGCQTIHAFDVTILGGSLAGLSAALTLGRSHRKVLVLDAAQPCNRFQARSYNLLTQNGVPPLELQAQARRDLQEYPTVRVQEGTVIRAAQSTATMSGFTIETSAGERWESRKIVLATGMSDCLPENLIGVEECWGKTVIHCPYCHGYEFREQSTGLFLRTSKEVMQMAPVVRSLTADTVPMTIFGSKLNATLDFPTLNALTRHGISLVPQDIVELDHVSGKLSSVILQDGTEMPLEVLYLRPPLVQATDLHQQLGLKMDDDTSDYIQVDDHQRTSRHGVYACGDCTTSNRGLSVALATGTKAGKMLHYELSVEDWSL